MPIHLLHHKSWNVYSTKNIERVRRDEAEAAAAAEAEATRRAAEESSHRLDVLRARAAGQPEPPAVEQARNDDVAHNDDEGAHRRKRQRTNQDHHINRVGLTGDDGHINLFPEKPKKVAKNEEYEAEKRAKEERWEAQNLGNALGKPAEELTPWYAALDKVGDKQRERETNERRTEWSRIKEERRKDWGDPLAMMKKASVKVKEVEDERREWRRMREREVGEPVAPSRLMSGDVGESRASGNTRDRKRRHGEDRGGGRYRSRSGDREREGSRHNTRRRSSSPRVHRRRRSTSRSPSRRSRHHHRSEKARPDAALEKLRAEAKQRETAEREKAEALLRNDRAAQVPGWEAVPGGRYSSQFGIGEVRKRRP